MKNWFLVLFFVGVHLDFAQVRSSHTESMLIDDVIKKGEYRLKIKQQRFDEKAVVMFKLYQKTKVGFWKNIQTTTFEKGDIGLTVDDSEDLNNDGYRDLKISCAAAGRGANSLEVLFIFNPKNEKLEKIVNSCEYPNLHYNEVKNCVVSYSFYGGSSTHFLRLVGNRLKEIGRVDWDTEFATSYRITDGNEILLKKIPYKSEDAAVFFDDFDPIK